MTPYTSQNTQQLNSSTRQNRLGSMNRLITHDSASTSAPKTVQQTRKSTARSGTEGLSMPGTTSSYVSQGSQQSSQGARKHNSGSFYWMQQQVTAAYASPNTSHPNETPSRITMKSPLRSPHLPQREGAPVQVAQKTSYLNQREPTTFPQENMSPYSLPRLPQLDGASEPGHTSLTNRAASTSIPEIKSSSYRSTQLDSRLAQASQNAKCSAQATAIPLQPSPPPRQANTMIPTSESTMSSKQITKRRQFGRSRTFQKSLSATKAKSQPKAASKGTVIEPPSTSQPENTAVGASHAGYSDQNPERWQYVQDGAMLLPLSPVSQVNGLIGPASQNSEELRPHAQGHSVSQYQKPAEPAVQTTSGPLCIPQPEDREAPISQYFRCSNDIRQGHDSFQSQYALGQVPRTAVVPSQLSRQPNSITAALQHFGYSNESYPERDAPQDQKFSGSASQATITPSHLSLHQVVTTTAPHSVYSDWTYHNSQNENSLRTVPQTATAPPLEPEEEDIASQLLKQFQTTKPAVRRPELEQDRNGPKAAFQLGHPTSTASPSPFTTSQEASHSEVELHNPATTNRFEKVSEPSQLKQNKNIAGNSSKTGLPTTFSDTLSSVHGPATPRGSSEGKPRGRPPRMSKDRQTETSSTVATQIGHSGPALEANHRASMPEPTTVYNSSKDEVKKDDLKDAKLAISAGEQSRSPETDLGTSPPSIPLENISPPMQMQGSTAAEELPTPRRKRGRPKLGTGKQRGTIMKTALRSVPPYPSPSISTETTVSAQGNTPKKKRGRPKRSSDVQNQTGSRIDSRINSPSKTPNSQPRHRTSRNRAGHDGPRLVFHQGSNTIPSLPGPNCISESHMPTANIDHAAEGDQNTLQRRSVNDAPPTQSKTLPELSLSALFYGDSSHYPEGDNATTAHMPQRISQEKAIGSPGSNKVAVEMVPEKNQSPTEVASSYRSTTVSSSRVLHEEDAGSMHISQSTARKGSKKMPYADTTSSSRMRTSQQNRQSTAATLSAHKESIVPFDSPGATRGQCTRKETPQRGVLNRYKRPCPENNGSNISLPGQNPKNPQVVVSQTSSNHNKAPKRRRLEDTRAPHPEDAVVIPSSRVNGMESIIESRRGVEHQPKRSEQPLVKVNVPSTPSRSVKTSEANVTRAFSGHEMNTGGQKQGSKLARVEITTPDMTSHPKNGMNGSADLGKKMDLKPMQGTDHEGGDKDESGVRAAPLQRNPIDTFPSNLLKRPPGYAESQKQDSGPILHAPGTPARYPPHTVIPLATSAPQNPSERSWAYHQQNGTQYQRPYMGNYVPGVFPQPQYSARSVTMVPPPPQSQANLSGYSFVPRDSTEKNYLKGRPDVVKPLKMEDAMEKTEYNPATIARDILIATGRHPTEAPLNRHLFRLRDTFVFLDYTSDLDSFRWDLVDPTPVSQTAPRGPQPGQRE